MKLTSWMAVALAPFAAACGGTDKHCDTKDHACTWLGQAGQIGFTPDGKKPLDTEIYWTMDTLFASDNTVWFLDWNNHLVRRVTTEGKVVSVVGFDDPVFPGDGDASNPTAEKSPDGAPGLDVQLNHPTDLVEMPDHSIVFAAWHNHKIRRIDPSTGNVHLVGGGGAGFAGDGGPVTAALFKQPSRIAIDEAGDMFIIDQQNQRIRKVDTTGNISTIAGNGMQSYADGPAAMASFAWQIGDNPEPAGGIAYANNTLYVSDTQNNRIRQVDLNAMMVTTIAGTGDGAFGGDGGAATSAQLFHPRDIEVGPDGNLYVADTDNMRIRKIDLSTSIITTVAGTGEAGLDPSDDLLATDTKLNRPFGVDFDAAGNLYISDSLNSRILKVAK